MNQERRSKYDAALSAYKAGQLAEAERLCRSIAPSSPNFDRGLQLLGEICLRTGDLSGALDVSERALKRNAKDASLYNLRGNAQVRLNRFDDALASYDRALKLLPENPVLLMNRGNALYGLGLLEDAVASCTRAVAIKPDYLDALFNQGQYLQFLKQFDRAILSYTRALAINPDYPALLGELLFCKMNICDWADIAERQQLLAKKIADGKAASRPFKALVTSLSAALQRKCSEMAARALEPNNLVLPQSEFRYQHAKIRLGYFSADFRDHVVAHQIAELIACHDRAKFEVIGFSFCAPSDDPMRSRLEGVFDRLIDVSRLSDKDTASLARQLEIDIAVDLNGFTQGGRMAVFSMRAAPIQVSYLGYPGTSGATFIDVLIADETLIPDAEKDNYSEKICYMPDSYFATDSKRVHPISPLARERCGLPDSGFVFCCFNNSYKISPQIFDVWMRLLKDVNGSVLWLTRGHDLAVRNLMKEAKARGVDPDRLVFAPFIANAEEHLRRVAAADLFLDTLPYNAHATACDALSVGLPLLTCVGDAFPGRVAASLLRAVGMPELVTRSLVEYEALALKLATTPQMLRSLRDRLVANRLSQPLFNTALFAKHIESGYLSMWKNHQAGQPQDHIHVRLEAGTL